MMQHHLYTPVHWFRLLGLLFLPSSFIGITLCMTKIIPIDALSTTPERKNIKSKYKNQTQEIHMLIHNLFEGESSSSLQTISGGNDSSLAIEEGRSYSLSSSTTRRTTLGKGSFINEINEHS